MAEHDRRQTDGPRRAAFGRPDRPETAPQADRARKPETAGGQRETGPRGQKEEACQAACGQGPDRAADGEPAGKTAGKPG